MLQTKRKPAQPTPSSQDPLWRAHSRRYRTLYNWSAGSRYLKVSRTTTVRWSRCKTYRDSSSNKSTTARPYKGVTSTSPMNLATIAIALVLPRMLLGTTYRRTQTWAPQVRSTKWLRATTPKTPARFSCLRRITRQGTTTSCSTQVNMMIKDETDLCYLRGGYERVLNLIFFSTSWFLKVVR